MYKYKYKFRCYGSSGNKFWQTRKSKKRLSNKQITDIKQQIHEKFENLKEVYLKEVVKLQKVLVFSKSEFRSNADVHVRHILSPYLDVIDGSLVFFYEDDKYGESNGHYDDGNPWHLYPVSEDWCTNEQQMTLL